jgi:hypothetical protein
MPIILPPSSLQEIPSKCVRIDSQGRSHSPQLGVIIFYFAAAVGFICQRIQTQVQVATGPWFFILALHAMLDTKTKTKTDKREVCGAETLRGLLLMA